MLDHLDELLSLAVHWAIGQERRVLCEGVGLSEIEMADAKAIGVKNPERVRLLRIEVVPTPADPTLRAAAASLNFLSAAGCGFGQGYLFAEPMDGALFGAYALTRTVQAGAGAPRTPLGTPSRRRSGGERAVNPAPSRGPLRAG